MKTTETIFSLADALARSLGEGLLGQDAHLEDITALGYQIAAELERQVHHSRVTSPLVAKLEGKPYTLGYFRARTALFSRYLLGCYGRKAQAVLAEADDELLKVLLYAHVAEGLISYHQYVNRMAWHVGFNNLPLN